LEPKIYDLQAGADIAENYLTVDGVEIEPGTLVSTAPNHEAYVQISQSVYDPKLLGVVSTSPRGDLVLGGQADGVVPVALIGRVPVKVSTENGPIEAGDSLTSSSTPGVAMKATKAGSTIGKALQPYDSPDPGTVGKITVFVNLSWFDPSAYIGLDGNLGGINSPVSSEEAAMALGLPGVPVINQLINQSTNQPITNSTPSGSFDLAGDANFIDLKNRVGSVESQIESLRADIINSSTQSAFMQSVLGDTSNVPIASDSAEFMENLENATISGDLNVLGRTTVTDLGVTGNIAAGLLSIHGLDPDANSGDGGATINSVGDLNLQNNGLGGINILAGKVTIDTKGNIKTEGEITAKKINIDTKDQDARSLGSSVIRAGETSIEIETTAVTEKSRIFVTPTTKTGNRSLIVSQKSAETGFTVTLETPYSQDIKFDWWIVDEVSNP